jgi:cytochrome c oxidase cbb3-type subunit 2
VSDKMRALTHIGVPYTDAEINDAPSVINGHTELDALVAYLQGLQFHGEAKP